MWRSWTRNGLARIALACCLSAVSGCANTRSCIDPTGEHFFVQPTPQAAQVSPNQTYHDDPMGKLPWDDVVVLLQPCDMVAPVGGEVVLIAGVGGQDGLLRTNRRLEWTIAQGSVGHFVAVEKNGMVDWMLGDFNFPRIINNSLAVGSTSRDHIRLNRGTCTPDDDVHVLRGQGWITVTSPVEGDSHVTVVAPEVYAWNARMKSAVIHWVDAQWRLPPPAINPAGTKHVFTTTVTRQTNSSPCEGWRVRYEILDGPAAGFSPDGAASIEVPANAAGQACAEIFQKQPAHGTNRVSVQVIRPGDVPGANGQRLVIGSGTTTKTWTAADLSIRVSGPAVGSVGATLGYRVEVSNPGDLPTRDVLVTEQLPEGTTYVGGNPAAETSGRQLQWRLGEIGARQTRSIDMTCRADQQGSATHCFEATAAGGLKVSHCTATTIGAMPSGPVGGVSSAGASPIDVAINGPTQAVVGSKITFEIVVSNRGQTPATDLVIKDRYDEGLDTGVPAAEAKRAIESPLDTIPAGTMRRITVTFRVTRPGRLCQTVEVSGPNSAAVVRQSCVIATSGVPGGETAPPTGLGQPSQTTPESAGPPSLSVTMTGPSTEMAVDERARFVIDVTNTGATTLHQIRVADEFDPALTPKTGADMIATEGNRREGDFVLVWMVDSLSPGKSVQFEIRCKCQMPAAKACNRVSVTSQEGAQGASEACFAIRIAGGGPSILGPTTENPPEGELTMSIPGLHNPVAVNKGVTYRIQVTNNSAKTYRDVTLKATLPEGFVPSHLGTQGPGATTFRTDVKTGTVYFDPVFEVMPGTSLLYEVRGIARKPGQGQFRAVLSSPDLPQPIEQTTSAEAVQ